MKSLILLALGLLATRSFAADAEAVKIKGYCIGMPVETAMALNRSLLTELKNDTNNHAPFAWEGGQDNRGGFTYMLVNIGGGARLPDEVVAESSGAVGRIAIRVLAPTLFKIQGVDNQKIINAFASAYGLADATITPRPEERSLVAVWHHPSGVRITIRCEHDSLVYFTMERADDDASLRAKLN